MNSIAHRVAKRWHHKMIARLVRAMEVKWISDHKQYIDDVWEMYKKSYQTIGMHISSASGLQEYDRWLLVLEDDKPVAFNLFKTTPHGLKAGLLGSDGSAVGKAAVKNQVKERLKHAGVYAEVSHAVERLSEGAPVVCAIHVPKVLGKPIVPQEDGVHYQRKLEGVGLVIKKLVGNPKGAPSGPEGSCPRPDRPGEVLTPEGAKTASTHNYEMAEHLSCQLFEGEEEK